MMTKMNEFQKDLNLNIKEASIAVNKVYNSRRWLFYLI